MVWRGGRDKKGEFDGTSESSTDLHSERASKVHRLPDLPPSCILMVHQTSLQLGKMHQTMF